MNAIKRSLPFSLVGPSLKSYWPLRLRDFEKAELSRFGTDLILGDFDGLAKEIKKDFLALPYPLSLVYRNSIGSWRHNRGRITKKGESKATLTNLGGVFNAKSRK